MNTFEENIQGKLTDNKLVEPFIIFAKSNPTFTYPVNQYPVSIEKTLSDFNYIKNILLDSIENGVFQDLPVPLQHSISSNVTSMFSSQGNQNQFTLGVQNAYHQIVVSGLDFKLKNLDKFRAVLKEVSSLQRTHSTVLSKLETTSGKVEEIQKLNGKANKLIAELNSQKDKSIETVDITIQGLKRIEEIATMAREKEQIVENSKKEILAFKENVVSYKDDIEKSSEKTKEIIETFDSQKEIVEKLIQESEKALSLKSSEGMSAALSAQYIEEGKLNKRRQWLVIASIFLFLTLVGLGLLIFEFSFGGRLLNPDSPNAIIARIVFVGVTIAGASFAAKQYLNQKRLADNYAYKLVLAKSIVAFAQEIKKHNADKAAEYMTNVLNELNRSPLRREKYDEDAINKENITLLERMKSLINAQ